MFEKHARYLRKLAAQTTTMTSSTRGSTMQQPRSRTQRARAYMHTQCRLRPPAVRPLFFYSTFFTHKQASGNGQVSSMKEDLTECERARGAERECHVEAGVSACTWGESRARALQGAIRECWGCLLGLPLGARRKMPQSTRGIGRGSVMPHASHTDGRQSILPRPDPPCC